MTSSMTARSTEALLHIAKYRFLTADQLEELIFGERTDLKHSSRKVMTRQVLATLQHEGFVQRTPRSVGGPEAGSTRGAYYLRPAGMQAVWSIGVAIEPKRSAPRGTFLLRHALALADVALAFHRSARANDGHALVAWEPDWEAAQHGGQHVVVPDAYAVYVTRREELYAFFEMDLGTAGSRFFQKKIERYLDLYRAKTWRERLPVWPSVLTVTPTETRSKLLWTATDRVINSQFDAESLGRIAEFAFVDLPTLMREGPLAPVWHRVGSAEPVSLVEQE